MAPHRGRWVQTSRPTNRPLSFDQTKCPHFDSSSVLVDDLHGCGSEGPSALFLLVFLSSTLIEAGDPPGDHLGLLTDPEPSVLFGSASFSPHGFDFGPSVFALPDLQPDLRCFPRSHINLTEPPALLQARFVSWKPDAPSEVSKSIWQRRKTLTSLSRSPTVPRRSPLAR